MTIIIIESHIKKKKNSYYVKFFSALHKVPTNNNIYIKLMSFEFSKFNIKPNVKFSNVSF